MSTKRKILKCKWVAEQTTEASRTGKVTVRSGHTIPVWLAFRCLYCGEYFSQAGAEEHFGTARIDYDDGIHDGTIKEIEVIDVRKIKKPDIR